MSVDITAMITIIIIMKAQVSKPQQPVTITPLGEIRGAYNVTRRGRTFESYRGIKYAQPPVGDLRFQPPQPISQYSSPVDASKEGPACPLPAENYYVDEDCLTINVYTPLKNERTKPLPVIFFIHPGGFYTMTGRSDLAGPNYLLDRDIVLVTINYRLGSLGFMSTGDELAPGNNGFKDQVMALKWVQKNIAAFGGDPSKVTIAGCSAGSISVMLLMISPMSKGLFHRGISMSGSPVTKVRTPTDMYDLAVKQAELLNCPTNNSRVIYDCLKTKPWQDFANSLPGFFEFGRFDPVGLWNAVVEKDFGQERFLPIDPMDAIREGKMHAVPWIVSQTEDEFYWFAYSVVTNDTLRNQMNAEWERIAPISFMLPTENRAKAVKELKRAYLDDKPLQNDQQSIDKLGRIYADSIEAFPVNRVANLMCRHSPQPVWYYEFSYVGNHSHYEDPKTGKPIKAAHHDDLIYLFSLPYRYPEIGLTGRDSLLVDRMTAIWYNFARYGDPNPQPDTPEISGLSWPTMKPDKRTYLRIDDQLTLHQNLFEDRLQLWEQLYPIEY
ncbi:juvenile hormone esterase-like isoform X2 [Aricia agestis]|uniref:juvenile hormone esterase-like isoform X2 n=1 Tax=Aricia agestis TaxID=91739 RepID=UPI001C209728|nr:juvenile hormone esterase-like isoform X2 [Aricia agestis]